MTSCCTRRQRKEGNASEESTLEAEKGTRLRSSAENCPAVYSEKNASDKIDAYIQQLMESSDLKETSRICDNEMLNAILCAINGNVMISILFF